MAFKDHKRVVDFRTVSQREMASKGCTRRDFNTKEEALERAKTLRESGFLHAAAKIEQAFERKA